MDRSDSLDAFFRPTSVAVGFRESKPIDRDAVQVVLDLQSGPEGGEHA
jgi:hypothetical protein